MIKALLLLLEPVAAWDRIVRAQRSIGFIFLTYLMPLLLLTSVAEGYGLVRWGKPRQFMSHTKTYSSGEALLFELAQFVLTVLCIFIGAKLVKTLGETFHGRNNLTQTFSAVAYGLGPMFSLRVIDAFPNVNPWIGWAIGILLSVAVLYQGVPRLMLPDPPHAFGLYLMSSLLLIVITGLARFVTAWYLMGKFLPVEKFISDLAARLPF